MKLPTSPNYTWTYLMPDGLVKVRDNQDKCGIVTQDDELIVPVIYDYVGAFTGDVVIVQIGDLSGLVNRKGEEILPPKYKGGFYFRGGVSAIQNNEGKWGYVNDKGEIILPCLFDEVAPYNKEAVFVRKGDRWLFADLDLNYYTADGKKQRINCGECPCYNDKLITGLCCQFNLEITGK